MIKIDVDAMTLRYFPRIGNRWFRLLICSASFFPYVYLIFPFKRLAKNSLNSFLLLWLFGLTVLVDGSFLLMDVKDRPINERFRFHGELIEFQGGRGVGGSKGFIVEGKEKKLFKALSIRSRASLDLLRRLQGEQITVWYLQASGLFTNWNLPVQIESANGGLVYDYSEHRNWFQDAASSFDKFLVHFYRLYSVLLVVLIPVQFVSHSIAKEGKES